MASIASGGNGTFRAGVYNFCVAVMFDATPAQLANIQTAFTNANRVWADALNGQQRFGTITIVNNCTLANNCGALDIAEFWIMPGAKTPGARANAWATIGKYGIRGEKIQMFYNGDRNGATNDGNFDFSNEGGIAYTIAHEMGHHSFGVLDEYKGPNQPRDAECAARRMAGGVVVPDLPDLIYSLMENFFIRGGKATQGAYTLHEFCTRSNHDPDGDTDQTRHHGKSAWEVIDGHDKRSARAPGPLQTTNPPAVADPVFRTGGGKLRSILVIDHSGSMADENRMALARQAASLYVDQMPLNSEVGVVSFETGVAVRYALTVITSAADRSAAKATINALSPSGATNIGGGLDAALQQLRTRGVRTCNEVVVLLTDGDHNTGTDPVSVIPRLQDDAVTVMTVGLGAGISTTGQALLQTIASETGGKYFGVASPQSLSGNFFEITADAQGNDLITRALRFFGANSPVATTVLVEQGSNSVTFGVATAASVASLTTVVRTPSGTNLATDAQVVAVGGSVNRSQANTVLYTFNGPAAGTWTLTSTSTTSTNGEVFASSSNPGTSLVASPGKGLVQSFETSLIQATLQHKGLPVSGATVTGTVIRPGGSERAVALFDDGSSASGDAIPGDGIYTAKFQDYDENGTYTVRVASTASAGRIAPGEDFFGDGGPGDVVPAYARYSSSSFVVAGYDGCSTPTQSIIFNLPVTASLTNGGCTSAFRNGANRIRYSFTGTAGQQVAVDLSAGFDTYLFLIGPDGSVVDDDDGGSGTNSRIPASSGLYTLPFSGVYVVEATSYSSGVTGPFTVTVSTPPVIMAPPSSVTAGNVTLAWTGVAGATSYDYRVQTTGGALVASGSTANLEAVVALNAGNFVALVRACVQGACGPFAQSGFTAVASTFGITAPNQNQVIATANVTISWTQRSGASGYAVRVTRQGQEVFSGQVAGANSLTTVVSLPSGTFNARVRPCFDAAFTNCENGEARDFTVQIPAPSSAPVITNPANGAVLTTTTHNLTWTAVAGADSYAVTLRNNTAGVIDLQHTVIAPATNTIFSMRSGSYTLSVSACTASCGPAGTSNFTVNLPPVPTTAPSISSCAVANSNNQNSVSCQWSSVSGADLYALQIVQPGAGPGGGALTVASRQVSQTNAALLVPNGAAVALVAGCNGNGCGPFGAGSPINPNFGNPAQPVLATPIGGMTTQGPSIGFSWSRVPGDNGSNTVYRLFVQDFARQQPALDILTTANFYGALFNAGRRYDALVIAHPSTIGAVQGPPQGFATIGNNPASPTLVAPSHEGRVSSGNVTISWTPLPGAELYQYYVSGTQNPNATGVTTGIQVQVPLTGNNTVFNAIVRACPQGGGCLASSDAGWGPWSNAPGGAGTLRFTVAP